MEQKNSAPDIPSVMLIVAGGCVSFSDSLFVASFCSQ